MTSSSLKKILKLSHALTLQLIRLNVTNYSGFFFFLNSKGLSRSLLEFTQFQSSDSTIHSFVC